MAEEVKKEKPVKIVVCDVFPERPPSNFYIKSALDQFVFFKTKLRQIAQAEADKEYGKGKYTIRVCGF